MDKYADAVSLSLSCSGNWHRFAEGGAHEIFQYCGDDPVLNGKILRVRKSTAGGKLAIAERNLLACEITRQLFGDRYLPWSIVVDDRELMDNLIRPGHMTVEIKPKWGYIPQGYARCRNCLNRRLKNEPVVCTLGLFSNDVVRVREALVALVGNPSNTLTIWPTACINDENLLNKVADILVETEILICLAKHQRELERLPIEQCLEIFAGLNESLRLRINSFATISNCILNYINGVRLANEEHAVVEYLLSMALKDLSIIININEAGSYDVKVIDVDIKPAEKLQIYMKKHLDMSTLSMN